MKQEFNAAVLAWYNSRGKPARQIISVTGRGSDWAGDTENGFHSTFDVDVVYLDDVGKQWWDTLEGEELGLLWNFVVGGSE